MVLLYKMTTTVHVSLTIVDVLESFWKIGATKMSQSTLPKALTAKRIHIVANYVVVYGVWLKFIVPYNNGIFITHT